MVDGVVLLVDDPDATTSTLDATFSGLQAEGLDIELGEVVASGSSTSSANASLLRDSISAGGSELAHIPSPAARSRRCPRWAALTGRTPRRRRVPLVYLESRSSESIGTQS